MAPRLRPVHLPSSFKVAQVPESTICLQCRFRQRYFSDSPRSATAQRDAMFRWINGPGASFKQPLPGSTNYLNAYDLSGNLIRSTKPRDDMPPQGNPGESDRGEKEETIENQAPRKRAKSEKLIAEQKEAMKQPGLPVETNDDLMPFPMNRNFRSQNILSDELKAEIYDRVMVQKKSVRDVSAALLVDMRRVAAVVRLVAVEKQWEAQGKTFATSYAKAIKAMLPQTPYIAHDVKEHETINDLPVHSATTRQVFHPVSESRHFTRRDAGKVFDRTLLPAEDRIPHRELYEMDKWAAQGVVPAERSRMRREIDEKEANAKVELERLRKEKERFTVKKAITPRWEFRFEDINAEIVGKDGRDRKGVGARYGMPHEDRKKGQIKIPTKVEA